MAKDGATVTQVDAQMKQIVFRIADRIYPERHDLHIPACSGRRDRVFSEITFDLDDAEHQFGIEPGASSFIVNGDQKCPAFLDVRYPFSRRFVMLSNQSFASGPGG